MQEPELATVKAAKEKTPIAFCQIAIGVFLFNADKACYLVDPPLPDLRDYKMRGHGTRSACKRGNGECRGIPCRVADGENRVDRCGSYHSHSHDLRRSRSPTCNGIFQILTVQGQNQLPGLGNADLEPYLIRAD